MKVFFTEHGDGTPVISLSDPAEEWCIGATITGEQVRELHAACSAWLKSAGIFPKSPPNPSEKAQARKGAYGMTIPTGLCGAYWCDGGGEYMCHRPQGHNKSLPHQDGSVQQSSPPNPSEKEQHNGK
jgi:hypothetical protein